MKKKHQTITQDYESSGLSAKQFIRQYRKCHPKKGLKKSTLKRIIKQSDRYHSQGQESQAKGYGAEPSPFKWLYGQLFVCGSCL